MNLTPLCVALCLFESRVLGSFFICACVLFTYYQGFTYIMCFPVRNKSTQISPPGTYHTHGDIVRNRHRHTACMCCVCVVHTFRYVYCCMRGCAIHPQINGALVTQEEGFHICFSPSFCGACLLIFVVRTVGPSLSLILSSRTLFLHGRDNMRSPLLLLLLGSA